MYRDGKSMQCSHEWYAAVPNELRSDIHEIPSGQLMIIKKLLDTAGIMTIKDVDTLAGEYYFLKRLCLAKGIQSIGGIRLFPGIKRWAA
jgi:hypothetical protein